MAGQTKSEDSDENENLNPDSQKAIQKKKLSTQDRKHRRMFEKSGMKKGALLRFFVKKDEDVSSTQAQQPTTSTTNRVTPDRSRNRLLETNNNNVLEVNGGNREEEAGELVNLSQDSSIIFEGEVSRSNKDIELVDIHSESSSCISQENNGKISNNAQDADDETSGSDNPSPPIDDGVPSDPTDPSPENHQDSTSSEDSSAHLNSNTTIGLIPNLPEVEPMSTSDKVGWWQKRNYVNASSENDDGPSPSKTSRRSKSPICTNNDNPARTSPVSSPGSPMMKITRVFSVNPTEAMEDRSNSKTISNQRRPSTTSSVTTSDKRLKPHYTMSDNSLVSTFIGKKNWTKALKVMSDELHSGKLPRPNFVSSLIKVNLGEFGRVAKKVQKDIFQFLEILVQEYSPEHGNRTDATVVRYYKEMFENVFGPADDETGLGLYEFLMEICQRAETELSQRSEPTNPLRVLVFVTNLVVDQFNKYESEKYRDVVKVNPPLFQHFLEDKEERYLYDPCCNNIVERLFNTTVPEMMCVYLKWVDLISRSFQKGFRQKEHLKLVEDFAQRCGSKSDLGLLYFLNLNNKAFCRKVCEKMFERLTIISSESQPENTAEMNDIRNKYLKWLANTMLIRPATMVITDLSSETCIADESLTWVRTRMERDLEPPTPPEIKRKNAKGETRLHALCNTSNVDNPLEEIRRHMKRFPEDINAQDNYGNTPLHDCAHNDKGNIIVELMSLNEHGKIPVKIDFFVRNRSLETPMHLAAIDCTPQNAEILKFFATSCGEQDVLLAPNKAGKLPFEVAVNRDTRKKLKPENYDPEAMFHQFGVTLDSRSKEEIKKSFPLRLIIAWWNSIV